MKKLPIYLSLLFVLTCAKEDSQAPNTPPTQIVKQYTLTAAAGDGGSVSGGGISNPNYNGLKRFWGLYYRGIPGGTFEIDFFDPDIINN